MLGIKVKNVTFSKEYSEAELYEAIKDHPFTGSLTTYPDMKYIKVR